MQNDGEVTYLGFFIFYGDKVCPIMCYGCLKLVPLLPPKVKLA